MKDKTQKKELLSDYKPFLQGILAKILNTRFEMQKMTGLMISNGAMWLNRQHFSGLLRPLRFALSPRNDDTRQRHCELAKQSRNTEYQHVDKTCHWQGASPKQSRMVVCLDCFVPHNDGQIVLTRQYDDQKRIELNCNSATTVAELQTMYMQLINKQVKKPHHNNTIGIILCRTKNRLEVEYMLELAKDPMGVATYNRYSQLPAEYAKYLPAEEELGVRLSEFIPNAQKIE